MAFSIICALLSPLLSTCFQCSKTVDVLCFCRVALWTLSNCRVCRGPATRWRDFSARFDCGLRYYIHFTGYFAILFFFFFVCFFSLNKKEKRRKRKSKTPTNYKTLPTDKSITKTNTPTRISSGCEPFLSVRNHNYHGNRIPISFFNGLFFERRKKKRSIINYQLRQPIISI